MGVYKAGPNVGRSCRTKTCKNCSRQFPTRITIGGKSRDLNIRKYCLDCSPFGARNSRKLEEQRIDGLKTCTACQRDLPLEVFRRSESMNGKRRLRSGACFDCVAARRRTTRDEFKRACINYKGGKCSKCGYSTCVAALSFHHLDPAQKDFEISRVRWYTPDALEKVKPELNKCALLCLNCHAEEHFIGPPILTA